MDSEPQPTQAEQRELDPVAELLLDEIIAMSPGEVVALWRNYTNVLEPIHLTDAIEELPRRSLAHGEAVFRTFVESPLDDDRHAGSLFISALTPHNHDLGLELWQRLVRDESAAVRREATDELRRLPDMNQDDATEHLDKLGITFAEATTLLATAAYAESSGDTFDLGRSVVERVNERLSATGQNSPVSEAASLDR